MKKRSESRRASGCRVADQVCSVLASNAVVLTAILLFEHLLLCDLALMYYFVCPIKASSDVAELGSLMQSNLARYCVSS